jgi:hypothetical protein
MATNNQRNETVTVDSNTFKLSESIFKEIERQFDETLKTIDTIDTKIGVMLGFVFVFIGLVFNKDLLPLVFASPLSVIILFVVGSILIIISVFSGILAIFFRKFQVGPDIDELYDQCRDKPEDYIKGVIAGRLIADKAANKIAIDAKLRWAKRMFGTFFLGLVTIVILDVGCFGKLW